MLAFLQTNTPIVIFNQIVVTLLTVCFLYQVVFFVIGALRGEVAPPKAKKLHRYAFFIAAHNEEAVIANLVRSIKDQDYPSELIEVFVVADACTDNTAQLAREAGAIVYERNDLARKGKSWSWTLVSIAFSTSIPTRLRATLSSMPTMLSPAITSPR